MAKKLSQRQIARLQEERHTIAKKHGFELVAPFFEGLAVAHLDGKKFHVKPNGERAYEHEFDLAGPFSCGLALVCKDGEFWHITPDGNPAYDQRYQDARPFCEQGFGFVRHNGMWVKIAADGTRVVA